MNTLSYVFFFFVICTYCRLSLGCSGLSGVPSIPVGGGGGGGGGGLTGSHEKHCLHWNGQVRVFSESNETRSAHQLEIGDRVLAYSSQRGFHSSPVVSILNRDLIVVRQFVRLTTSEGHRVTVTPEHGVYSGPCAAGKRWSEKRADTLTVGDCVKTASGREDEVVEVEPFIDSGIVKPITETGSIVVDGVVVSCYDYDHGAGTKKMETNPHQIYEPYRLLYSMGERLYKGMQEGKFAINLLESLISATGLEKMYS